MKIIELKKNFGNFAIDIEDWHIERGQMHAVIGPNGCGKTAAAKLIMDMIKPDVSDIDFEGVSRRDITMAPQKPYMLHDSVYNNLVYPLKVRGIKPDRAAADAWLETCGLLDMKKQYAPTLSSGQQQKLSLARALIFRPKIIIIDECLSNLDPDSVELFEGVFREIQRERGATWIIISHQLSHVREMCKTVHFMSGGKIIQSGSADDIIKNRLEPEINRYLRHETL